MTERRGAGLCFCDGCRPKPEVVEAVNDYCARHPHLEPYLEKRKRERRKKPSAAEAALACFRGDQQ